MTWSCFAAIKNMVTAMPGILSRLVTAWLRSLLPVSTRKRFARPLFLRRCVSFSRTTRNAGYPLDLGKDVIRYALRTVRMSESVTPIEAGGFTTRNWQGSFGIGFDSRTSMSKRDCIRLSPG